MSEFANTGSDAGSGGGHVPCGTQFLIAATAPKMRRSRVAAKPANARVSPTAPLSASPLSRDAGSNPGRGSGHDPRVTQCGNVASSPIPDATRKRRSSRGHDVNETHHDSVATAPIPVSNDGGADGHCPVDTQEQPAIGAIIPSSGEGGDQASPETQMKGVPARLIARIRDLHREHRAFELDRGNVDRQIKAEERRASLARHIRLGLPIPKGKWPTVSAEDVEETKALRPRFYAASEFLEEQRLAVLHDLLFFVNQLPVVDLLFVRSPALARRLNRRLRPEDWKSRISGFGIKSLAAIVGEAGDLGAYAKPGKLWKRMGVAVFDGMAQGRVPSGLSRDEKKEAWIARGYSPRRRSELRVIGYSLEKSKGALRRLYIERKAREIEKAREAGLIVRPAKRIPKKDAAKYMSEGHIRNRTLRYIEKRLLLEVWKAWRAASVTLAPNGEAPFAESMASPA